MSSNKQLGGLLFGALLVASQTTSLPAYADEAQLQRQIDIMKRQLEKMQQELAQSKKQPASPRVAGAPAGAAVVTARNGNEIVIPAPAAPPPAGGATMLRKRFRPGLMEFISPWPGPSSRRKARYASIVK